MVPFGLLIVIRHLVSRGPQKGTIILITTQIDMRLSSGRCRSRLYRAPYAGLRYIFLKPRAFGSSRLGVLGGLGLAFGSPAKLSRPFLGDREHVDTQPFGYLGC